MKRRHTPAEWKAAGTPRGAVLVRGAASVVARDGSRGNRLTFTVSTEDVDRMGDTVAADGWKLGAYRTNPVVLFAHDSSRPAVARAVSIGVREKRLQATLEFPPPGVHPEADLLSALYAGRFMSAVSVGFLPLRWQRSTDPERPHGIDFIEQELLEYSLVTIPANPHALVQQLRRGDAKRYSPEVVAAALAALRAAARSARPARSVSVRTIQQTVHEVFGEPRSERDFAAAAVFAQRLLSKLEGERVRVIP